jgi:diacylglycerol kinase (ATP)
LSAASGLIRIIWNPASGRGRGARAIGGILGAFAAHGVTDARGTRAAGDEARLVHEAIADGVETIVVAGGDGTWSKCAVALARASGRVTNRPTTPCAQPSSAKWTRLRTRWIGGGRHERAALPL